MKTLKKIVSNSIGYFVIIAALIFAIIVINADIKRPPCPPYCVPK